MHSVVLPSAGLLCLLHLELSHGRIFAGHLTPHRVPTDDLIVAILWQHVQA